jgi:hypothetical protein
VDGFAGGDVEVEDEQGHGDGENAIAEGGEALDALSGNTVVQGWHRRESSGVRATQAKDEVCAGKRGGTT